MDYFYLFFSVIFSSTSGIFGTFFNRRNEKSADGAKLYNFLQLSAVSLIWIIMFAFDYSFDAAVLPYSVAFAVSFTLCDIGIIYALKYGPASLTSLLLGLSLILTTVWGLIFWNAPVTVFVIIGIILVAASIFLCLYTGKREKKKISLKWLFFVSLAFFGNAACSIIQRTQQIVFNGGYKTMLMAVATTLSAIACFVIYLLGDKRDSKMIIKKSWVFPVAAGACNVFLNLFVMKLALSSLSPSFIYPVIGVGGLFVVLVFSFFVFKEKLRWWQWLGILLGALAIAML